MSEETQETTETTEANMHPSLDQNMVQTEAETAQTETTRQETQQTGDDFSRFSDYLSTPECLEEYRQTMKIPSNVKEYNITLPEGVDADSIKGDVDLLKQCGVNYGISPKAAEGLLSDFLNARGAAQQAEEVAYDQKRGKEFDELQRNWGGDFKANCENAKNTVGTLCNLAGVDPAFFSQKGITDSPELIRIFAKAAELLGEGKTKGIGSEAFSSNAEEARRIEKDKSHPLYEAYHDWRHPDYRRANETYNRLKGIQ